MRKQLLFLTGCIDPGAMYRTVLVDSAIRRKQYIDSISYYLKSTELPVLFVENTGNDLSSFFSRELEEGRLEILTFEGNQYDQSRGKGYGEMLIIEHAISYSNFFHEADFIYKITGRFKVLNINSYVDFSSKNHHDLLVNLNTGMTWADSRFWGASNNFFEKFLRNRQGQVNDSDNINFEHILCKSVLESIIEGYSYSGLNTYPRISGIRGTDGSRINDSWIYWFVKELIFKMLNYIHKIFKLR